MLEENKLNDVYRQRGLAVVALANQCIKLGYKVGVKPRTDDEWAILYMEFPAGQVSYHFKPDDEDLICRFPRIDNIEWDGTYNGRSAEFMRDRTAM